MDNLFVTASNLMCIPTIYTLYKKQLYGECILIVLSALSSILYHMLEHSKHEMTGIPSWSKYERIALNFDRFFAYMSIVVLIINHSSALYNRQFLLLGFVGLLSQFISEMFHYIPYLRSLSFAKGAYMFFHTIWHLLAFYCAYLAAQY